MLTSLLSAVAMAKTATPIAYQKVVSSGKSFHVVVANMGPKTMSAAISHEQRLTAPRNLLVDEPIAAITGTFFDPRSHIAVGDIIIDGEQTVSGYRGSAVGVDWFGQVKIIDTKRKQPVDWSLYRYAMRGAVRILSSGKVAPNPKAQGFKDSRIWGRAARTGIGVTKQGKVVLIATTQKVTLSELGAAMKKQGAYNGVSLDGGGSTFLYYKGKSIVPTSRRLSNLFLIYDKPPY